MIAAEGVASIRHEPVPANRIDARTPDHMRGGTVGEKWSEGGVAQVEGRR